MSMAVNVSARLLTDLDLPVFVAEVLERHGVPATRLTVEVTESTIMADPKRALEVLGRLRATGVSLAIDDYGTGYSSLSYLRRIEADELKIDKSFVLQMGLDDNSAIIVRSTIELGHSLGLTVTAEGVEDRATSETLRAPRLRPGAGLLPQPAAVRQRDRGVAQRASPGRRPSCWSSSSAVPGDHPGARPARPCCPPLLAGGSPAPAGGPAVPRHAGSWWPR